MQKSVPLRVVVVCIGVFTIHSWTGANISLAQSDSSSGSGSPIVASSTEVYRDIKIIGTERANGGLSVSVLDLQGRKIFESVYPVWKPDGPHVRWSYQGVETFTQSAVIKPGPPPTIKTMSLAARDIVRMARRIESLNKEASKDGSEPVIEPFDNWGCDVPDYANFTCTASGNCCDAHDECYATFGCTANSWFSGYLDPLCQSCNAFVVACVYYGIGNTGLPSECCYYGNCGQERCSSGLWNDPGCVPGTGGGDPYVPEIQDMGQDPGGGGGWYSRWGSLPGGGATFGIGICCFPDGQCISCNW